MPLPAGALAGSLDSVSCPTAASCVAVGVYADSGNENTVLAESWDGTSFTIMKFPLPRDATTSALSAVSCSPAPSTQHRLRGRGLQLPARPDHRPAAGRGLNGTKWSIQHTPKPKGGPDGSYAYGMSCGSASECTSTGFGSTSAGYERAYAQAWNGTSWADQAIPQPKHTVDSVRSAVSCSTATSSACTAVGYYDNGTPVLSHAEGWNGTKWSIQATPAP